MNIENIEAFVYVLHFGSFKKAADALFLSQSSVTSRIQSLEADLKCRLFDRDGRQISLTNEGRLFLPHAQQILESYRKSKLQLQRKPAPNELKIGCTSSGFHYIISALLPDFKRKFPEVKIKLTTKTNDCIVRKVLDREIDIGFVRNTIHAKLDSFRLFDDPIRLYVHEGHPFIGKKRITLEEVSRQPLVFLQCGSLDWVTLHRIFESLEHPPNIVYQVDHLEALKRLILQGLGIGFLPEYCVRNEVSEKKLFRIDLSFLPNISLTTNMISLKESNSVFIGEFLRIAQAKQA